MALYNCERCEQEVLAADYAMCAVCLADVCDGCSVTTDGRTVCKGCGGDGPEAGDTTKGGEK